MRKSLYVFIGVLLCQNAFAESGATKQNQHVKSILIPRVLLEKVIRQDTELSGVSGAVEKMLAKYDELAGPFGQEPLTINDVTQICVASDVITKKDDCLNRVFNPVLAEMGKVRFINVCTGKISGGTPYCINDVFVEGKKQDGNQYHQDVNVNPYAANGFAIEYAKKNGHDVWCSTEIQDSTVKCTTLDNKNFYSVKFKGTNNTADATIEKNLVKGICALFDAKYAIGTFRHQCKMDCTPGTEARKVIEKFGLTVHDGYSTDTHCEIYQPTYTVKDVKTYPGYEYMSLAFKNIQSVLDSSLIEVLKTYVQLQGINVQSFDCDYSAKRYNDVMPSGSLQGMPMSMDDMLRCQVNGTEVDFIFDDLFEEKEYERKSGAAAMQCILAGGQYGADKLCSGLTKQKCLSPEIQSMVPGGTRWDSKAEVCLLNSVEKARDISNALQVGSGIALAIVFTPTGIPFVGLAAVVGSVAFDAASIGVERLKILEPASRARAFAEDAQKCQIAIGSKYPSCSKEQIDCAWKTVNQHFYRIDEILDKLNPDQMSLVSDLMENVADCLSDDLLHSAVNMSTPNAWDKALNNANAFLLITGIFIQPEKSVIKIYNPKAINVLRRGGRIAERTSDMFKGKKYLSINIDDISPTDVEALKKEFKNAGLYVSEEPFTTTQGGLYIGVAEDDIFKSFGFRYKDELNKYSTKARDFLERFEYGVYEGDAKTWQDVLIKWNLPTNTPDADIERKYREMLAELDSIASGMGPGEAGYLFEKLTEDYNMLKNKPGFKWVEPDYDGWLHPTYNRYMYGTGKFDLTGTAFESYSKKAQDFLTSFEYAVYEGNARTWQDVLKKWHLPIIGTPDADIESKYRAMLAELDRMWAHMGSGEAGYLFEKLVTDYEMLKNKPGFNWIKPDQGWVNSTYTKYMQGPMKI